MTSNNDIPRNRRERRSAAKESRTPIAPPTSTPKIKLQQPDRSAPQVKTLLHLYEEKRDLLAHGQPFSSTHQDGSGNDDEDPIGPIGNAIFWSISLTTIHFTLDVLVYNQYMQVIEWGAIFRRTLIALPLLVVSLLLTGCKTALRFPLARQVFFFGLGVGTGCYVIYVANVYDYFAVMKQAPPLGTLWVWSVIEMRLHIAVASLLVNGVFLYWKGYSVI